MRTLRQFFFRLLKVRIIIIFIEYLSSIRLVILLSKEAVHLNVVGRECQFVSYEVKGKCSSAIEL